MAKLIIFDLEGPLSPMDFGYESMGLFDVEVEGKRYSGKAIFEVISRWDDLLTLDKEHKVPGHIPDYEPGDTLSWIVPHLIYHKIREDDFCSAFPLGDFRKVLKGQNLSLIGEFEKQVSTECFPYYPIREDKDKKIREICE